MRKVSLIKKIEYQKNSSEIYPVTFELGRDFDRDRVIEVYTLIKSKSLLAKDSMTLGTSTFTIQILLDTIPIITKILIEKDLAFYGIFVLYDNYLGLNKGETNE